EAAHERPQLVGEQRNGAVQRGEDTAAVDVPHDDRGQARGRGHAQVHDVVVEQVDLGRAAGALDNDHVEARAQIGEAVEHNGQQGRLLPVVRARVDVRDGAAEHDD